jgi:hypothetical protein
MTTSRHEPSVSELVDFRWHRLSSPRWQTVHRDGSEDLDKDGNVVTSYAPSDRVVMLGEEGEAYDPLKEEPALFLKFAGLDDTEEAFAEFARRYGRLTRPHVFASFADQVIAEYSADKIEGFAGGLDEWSGSRLLMSRVVRLWEGLRAGRATEVISADYRTRIVGESRLVYAATDVPDPVPYGLPPELQFGDRAPLLVVPNTATDRDIAQGLLRRGTARMLVAQGVSLSLAATGQPYGSGLRLTFGVYTLEAAMWLQLALAIDGNREYQICEVCGEWWDATDARSHKKVCSDKCRAKKSYQARMQVKKQAEGKG